jgi:hypothetical protein
MEKCDFCRYFTCETKTNAQGTTFKTLQDGGEIFKRNFEIADCEIKAKILALKRGENERQQTSIR